jgi:hypothetical protein
LPPIAGTAGGVKLLGTSPVPAMASWSAPASMTFVAPKAGSFETSTISL